MSTLSVKFSMAHGRLQTRWIVPMTATMLVALVGATAAFLMAAVPSAQEELPAPPPAIRSSTVTPRYVGAGSCAARACHGNPNLSPGQEWNSSYAVWVENDPHSKAYQVLFTDESKRMASALGLGDPWRANRCLACHSISVNVSNDSPPSPPGKGQSEGADNAAGAIASALSATAKEVQTDGVSCELCHGPAENYLVAHTVSAWLPKVKSDPRFGMKGLADISVRAQVCAGCHVGQPGPDGKPWRDVNHDLIAAGHPRLSFELSAFMATIPPHWNARKNPARFDELRSWLEGQFAGASAALKLLESRAKAAAVKKPAAIAAWPEFAEYDCFACHHALNSPSWRQALPAGAEHRSGAPRWGSWYFDGLEALDSSAPVPQSQRRALLDRLTSIGHELESLIAGNRPTVAASGSKTPASIAQDVAAIIPDARTKLEACRNTWLGASDATDAVAKKSELRTALLHALWNRYEQHEPANWDECAQLYLVLVAIDRSQAAGGPQNSSAQKGGPATVALNQIRDLLRFPDAPMTSSAKSDRAGQPTGGSTPLRVLKPGFNSPADFNPRAAGLPQLFRQAFQQLSSMSAPL